MFFEAPSRAFLEPAFTKTTRLAQYHGVLEAARRLHDEHLSVGYYHLFRLPEEAEQDLHRLMQEQPREEFVEQQGKEAALAALKNLATPPSARAEGPVAVGSVEDLSAPDILGKLAGAYLAAFEANSRVFPYLVN